MFSALRMLKRDLAKPMQTQEATQERQQTDQLWRVDVEGLCGSWGPAGEGDADSALTPNCSGSGCISPAGKQRLKQSSDSNPSTNGPVPTNHLLVLHPLRGERPVMRAKSSWSPLGPGRLCACGPREAVGDMSANRWSQ